ncbi:hypothetical protein GQ607_007880 [Colletotrichum asianum]|uniref:Uncharacterized protein n=1 Tax=Colletotrichum asianum TaxID=702518 RepID=A0A8H3WFQ2_9PEZI|nr:hypothetical protein GQ607_007880 [Colletotrichum asianum]
MQQIQTPAVRGPTGCQDHFAAGTPLPRGKGSSPVAGQPAVASRPSISDGLLPLLWRNLGGPRAIASAADSGFRCRRWPAGGRSSGAPCISQPQRWAVAVLGRSCQREPKKNPGQLVRAQFDRIAGCSAPINGQRPWHRTIPAATKALRHRSSATRVRCIASTSRTDNKTSKMTNFFLVSSASLCSCRSLEGSFWKAPAEGCGCAGRLSCPCRLKVKFVSSSQLSDVRRRASSDRQRGVICH